MKVTKQSGDLLYCAEYNKQKAALVDINKTPCNMI
jgi:hypothetical protein